MGVAPPADKVLNGPRLLLELLSRPNDMSTNDFALVSAIVHNLRACGMDVWVFGGLVEGLTAASDAAPKMYRRDHDRVDRACAEFRESRTRTG
jgi:hypothetical protein